MLTNRLKTFIRKVRQVQGVRYAFEEYGYTRDEMAVLITSAGFHILEVAPDDFQEPYDMGLYVDFPFLRHPKVRWRLNSLGKFLRRRLQRLSPWIACSGTVFICEKEE